MMPPGGSMVWVVTRQAADDHEVVQGVFLYSQAAYRFAMELVAGSEGAAQETSVMAHAVNEDLR